MGEHCLGRHLSLPYMKKTLFSATFQTLLLAAVKEGVRGLKTESVNQRKVEENNRKGGLGARHSGRSKVFAPTISKYYPSITQMNQFEITAFFVVSLLYNISVYILNLHQCGRKIKHNSLLTIYEGKKKQPRSTVGPDKNIYILHIHFCTLYAMTWLTIQCILVINIAFHNLTLLEP